jgi:predicted O-methyltransferase YrrM
MTASVIAPSRPVGAKRLARAVLSLGEVGTGALDAPRVARREHFDEVLVLQRQLMDELRDDHRQYASGISAPDHAVSLETAALLAALLEVHRPQRVLDLGSGFSSYVVRSYGDAGSEVVSVDDSPSWLGRTRAYLEGRGSGRGELVDAEWLRTEHPPFDLVFNDIGTMRFRSRWLPAVAGLVAPDGIGLLDDYHKYRYRRLARAHAAVEGARILSLRRWTIDDIGRYAALWVPGASRAWKRWE